MAALCLTSAANTPELSRWWLIFTGSDGGLDVRNPDALELAQELADSVNSEFVPGGQHSDYQPGDGGSATLCLTFS